MRAKAAWKLMTWTSVRKKGSYRYLFSKPVADSTNCLQCTAAACRIELTSKVFDMYVHDITKSYIIEVPQMVEQVLPIHDLIRVAHKVFEQTEFFEREIYLLAGAGDAPLGRVELDIASPVVLRQCLRGGPHERPQTRGEFRKEKGFEGVVSDTRRN